MNRKIIVIAAVAIVAAAAIAAGVIFATGALTPTQEQNNTVNDDGSNINNTALSTETRRDKLKIIASFFPLYDFARHVGGDKAEVSSIIPIGIEPHDWEPTAQNVVAAQEADMLIFNGAGFEGRWITEIESNFKVDTSKGIQLLQGGGGGEHEGEEENGGGTSDPHIWLDPVLARHQVEVIRDAFIELDPENASYYRDNAARYISELESLDALIKSELLSNCTLTDFIAFHDAFSYFAERYGLTQHSIHGVSPAGEILPQRITQIRDLAMQLGIDTIYSEDLVDPRLATVVANEIPNGRVLTLSPIEGIEKEELDQDVGYIQKMLENLENLKVGLKCQL
jgi:zinc transport system substrate-binding protein